MKSIIYIAAALLAVLPATSTLASYRQTVTVCVTVNNNHTDKSFYAGFHSTGLDLSKFTRTITGGTACRSHTYRHGPKTIDDWLILNNYDGHVQLDDSCHGYTTNLSDGLFGDDEIVDAGNHHTGKRHEKWTFTVTPNGKQFRIACSHYGWN